MANEQLSGGCLCGGLRYRLYERPAGINDCHCVDCRHAAGAPVVTWGTVSRAAFELISGSVRRVPYADRVRWFASCCGTPIAFLPEDSSPSLDIPIATLDDPSPFAPEVTIWIEDRLPWVTINSDLPAYPKESSR
jgi:hypothetical protein